MSWVHIERDHVVVSSPVSQSGGTGLGARFPFGFLHVLGAHQACHRLESSQQTGTRCRWKLLIFEVTCNIRFGLLCNVNAIYARSALLGEAWSHTQDSVTLIIIYNLHSYLARAESVCFQDTPELLWGLSVTRICYESPRVPPCLNDLCRRLVRLVQCW